MKECMIGGGMMLLTTGRTENRFLKIIKNKESEEDDNLSSSSPSSSPPSSSSAAAAALPSSSSSLTTLSVHVLVPSSSSSSSQKVRKFPFLLPKITSALVRPISSSSSSSSSSASSSLPSSLMFLKAQKRLASIKNPMAKRLKTISGLPESNNETKEINNSKNASRDNSPEVEIKTEKNKVMNDDVVEDDVMLSRDVIKTEMCERPENETNNGDLEAKERKQNNSLAETSHKVLLHSRSTKVTTGDIYGRRRHGRKICKIENRRKQEEQLISGKTEPKTCSRELLNLDEMTSERLKIELYKVSRSIDRASSLMRLLGNKLKTLEERKRTLQELLICRTEVTRPRNQVNKSSKMDKKWSPKRDILEEDVFDSSDNQIAAAPTPSAAHEHRYKMELFVSDLSVEVGDELPRAHEHKRDLSACTYLVCRR